MSSLLRSPYGVRSHSVTVGHRGGRTIESAKFIVNIYVINIKEFEIG